MRWRNGFSNTCPARQRQPYESRSAMTSDSASRTLRRGGLASLPVTESVMLYSGFLRESRRENVSGAAPACVRRDSRAVRPRLVRARQLWRQRGYERRGLEEDMGATERQEGRSARVTTAPRRVHSVH